MAKLNDSEVIKESQFLWEVAKDIWQNARMHATEQKTGLAMNPERMIKMIQREMFAAAGVVAERMMSSHERVDALLVQIGEHKATAKELRKQLRAKDELNEPIGDDGK